jgi:hypothetical protein
MKNAYLVENDNAAADASIDWLAALLQSPVFQRLPAVNLQKVLRGVAIFAKVRVQILYAETGGLMKISPHRSLP